MFSVFATARAASYGRGSPARRRSSQRIGNRPRCRHAPPTSPNGTVSPWSSCSGNLWSRWALVVAEGPALRAETRYADGCLRQFARS